jgi:hypothetical protein
MGGRVVQDQVHVQFGRYVVLNQIQKVAELLRAVAAKGLAQHRTAPRIERREQ